MARSLAQSKTLRVFKVGWSGRQLLDCASALALCEDVGATLTCSIRREPDQFTSGAVLSSRAADEV